MEKRGRPKNKEKTVNFHRRVTEKEKEKLDEYLKIIRNKVIKIEE